MRKQVYIALVILLSMCLLAHADDAVGGCGGPLVTNNTAACTTQSYCSAAFAALSTNGSNTGAVTGTPDPVPHCTSTVNPHSFIPGGVPTFAHFMGWFTTPGTGTHQQTKYNSNDTNTVAAQMNDILARHFDGIIEDWYGSSNTTVDGALQKIRDNLAPRCTGAQNCPLYFAAMIDQGLVKNACGGTLTGACAISAVESALCYLNNTYFASNAYLKLDPTTFAISSSGKLAVYTFPPSGGWNTTDWGTISTYAQNLSGNCPGANNGGVLLITENGAGASSPWNGEFAWPQPLAWSASNQLLYDGASSNYLENFYSGSNSTHQVTGAIWKGFDDNNANWGTNRVIAQQCGQVVVNTLAKATSAVNAMHVGTWNDYEEGTEVETGVDNCYRVNTPTLTGSVLSWIVTTNDNTYAPVSGGSPTNGTVDHWAIFYCDTSNTCNVAKDNIAAAATSFDLSTVNTIPAGTWRMYVQMISKPLIWNQTSSSYASYTSTTSGPTAITSPLFGATYNSVTPHANTLLKDGAIRLLDSSLTSWTAMEQTAGLYTFTTLTTWLADAKTHSEDVVWAINRTPPFYTSCTSATSACGCQGSLSGPYSPYNGTLGHTYGMCHAPSDIDNADLTTTSYYKFVLATLNFAGCKVTKPTGCIQYIEPWNEPDSNWMGKNTDSTTPQRITHLVKLMHAARLAVNAFNAAHSGTVKIVSPAPQGSATSIYTGNAGYMCSGFVNPDINCTNGIFGQGGGQYIDIVGFHGYVGSAATPEQILTDLTNVKTVIGKFSVLNGLPLWDTEDGFIMSSVSDASQGRINWIMRRYLLENGQSVARIYEYAYDNSSTGQLYNGTTLTNAGVAYNELVSWLTGWASTGACTVAGNLYTCDYTKAPNGIRRVVWFTSGSASYIVPSQYNGAKKRSYNAASNQWQSGTVCSTASCTETIGPTPMTFWVDPVSGVGDCTLWVSPTGGGNGLTSSTPETIQQANTTGTAGSVVAGSHVCVKGGIYSVSDVVSLKTGGTSTNHVVWEAYQDAPIIINYCTGSSTCGTPASGDHNLWEATNVSYIDFKWFNLLTVDGGGYASNGFLFQSNHHVTLTGVAMCTNFVRSCVSTSGTDYIQIVGNTASHNGFNPNSVTYGNPGCTGAFTLFGVTKNDSYSGLHNIIVNNIAVGQYDSGCHASGNGVKINTSAVPLSPPTLIANNVFYGNGGACIWLNTSGTTNIVANSYVINNTCYSNGLDTAESPIPANFLNQHSNTAWWINNISYAWPGRSGGLLNYSQGTSPFPTGQTYRTNAYFSGTGNDFTNANLISEDPKFVSPPLCDPSATKQYDINTALGATCAELPSTLANGLTLQISSPAIKQGIDPTTLPGLDQNIISDMRTWLAKDIAGNARPVGSNIDLGAYQSSFSPAADPAISGSGVFSGNGILTVQ